MAFASPEFLSNEQEYDPYLQGYPHNPLAAHFSMKVVVEWYQQKLSDGCRHQTGAPVLQLLLQEFCNFRDDAVFHQLR